MKFGLTNLLLISINSACRPHTQRSISSTAFVPHTLKMASLDTIFSRLTTAYNAHALGPNTDPKAKIQLRKAALELVAATQTPEEAAMLFATSNAVFPCYRVAADCGIFAALAKEEEGGLSAKELAGRTGADERLVGACVILLFGR